MALIFCDSFDHYTGNSQATRKGWSSDFNGNVTGRNGTSGVWTNGTRTISFTAGASFVVGCAFYFEGGGSDAAIFQFEDAGTAQCELRTINATKSLKITRDNNLLGTSATNVYNTSGFQYIEFKVTIGNTGSAEARVNGVVVLTVGPVDNQTSANSSANILRLGSAGNTHFDDFYLVSGTTYLGDVRIKAIFPDGAGNYAQFAPSAGSNYQCVDETPGNDDTDYISSSTAGHKDSYNFGAVGVTGSVKGVQVLASARKDDAGTRTVRRLIRIGGTDYTGSSVGLGSTYVYVRDVLDTSPATAGDWTVSEIDGAEFGVELVS